MCVFRTPTRDILSLTCTRTCWPKLSSPRRPKRGEIYQIRYIIIFSYSALKRSFILYRHNFSFFLPFLSACSPSWDASATPAPPPLRLSPRWQRKTGVPWGPGKQVPTLQPAPTSDAQKTCQTQVTSVSIVSVGHHSNHPRSSLCL